MFSTTDTIVAIATPPGHGGIGVVRVAGPSAPEVTARLIARREPLRPRHATFTAVVEETPDGRRTVDEVVVTFFKAPQSYTGDDVIEIGAHGSPVVLRRIVELAIAAGARLAEPGEFTFRAYLNGRLDLVQAEAVADLVDAVTPLQARAALDQLEGTLTTAIAGIEGRLFDLVAKLEASIDFPDEGFHFIERGAAAVEVEAIAQRIADLLRDGRRGRMIREGAIVAIAGSPNVGKSRLFNALLGAERAIVTDIAGTTRDLLAERTDIGGVPVTLVDTAGVRETEDQIEAEGVRRARQAHDVARVVLIVLDGSVPLTDADRSIIAGGTKSRMFVVNKSDLALAWSPVHELRGAEGDWIVASALTGEGLDEVRAGLLHRLSEAGEDRRDVPVISNVRHLGLVQEAHAAVERAAQALRDGATEELVLAELSVARVAFEAVVGRKTADDLLEHVFSRFCVGK